MTETSMGMYHSYVYRYCYSTAPQEDLAIGVLLRTSPGSYVYENM